MSKQISNEVAEFLKDAITNQPALINKFDEKFSNFTFNEADPLAWQYIVLKSFEPDFSYLLPLSHHLIDHNFLVSDANVLQLAAFNAYKVEVALNEMKKIENQLNETMAGFNHFDEKLVIKNEPMENIYNLSKKLFLKANQTDIDFVVDLFEKTGISKDKFKLFEISKAKQFKPS